MYGNVVTNKQLRNLLGSNCLTISPFEEQNLKAAAYTLTPGRVLRRGEDGEYDVVHTFKPKRKSFTLAPDEYVVVEAKQSVAIRVAGVVGTFITASTNIENGLLIVAGQIDGNYGTGGEALRFGIKNLLSQDNQISVDTRLVHLQLVDMRGSATDPVKLSKEAQKIWDDRKRGESWLEQHGPNYSQADEN